MIDVLMYEKILSKKNETIAVTYSSASNGNTFILTRSAAKGYYVLYEISSGKLNKIGTGDNPIELERKYAVMNKLRE